MTDAEYDMYGISVADIRADYMDGITAKLTGLEMVVMGILSDAQYMLEMQRPEHSRKLMNTAKFILGEMLASKREATYGSLS